MRSCFLVLGLAAATITPSLAAASTSPWDFIYTDRLDVTLCEGCGIGAAGKGFALLVNTGSADITAQEFFGASFSAVSSHPGFTFDAFINDPGSPVAPILAGEAVGGVTDEVDAVSGSTTILLTGLLPGEVFRNTYPEQVIGYRVWRLSSAYEGPVRFDVEMVMGDRIAFFTINADMHLGGYYILFPSAARVSSVPLATPVARTSWGRLKALYR
jgi:hypothetical protein